MTKTENMDDFGRKNTYIIKKYVVTRCMSKDEGPALTQNGIEISVISRISMPVESQGILTLLRSHLLPDDRRWR